MTSQWLFSIRITRKLVFAIFARKLPPELLGRKNCLKRWGCSSSGRISDLTIMENGSDLASDLEQKQKKERKELQAKITSLKHSIGKTDTKKRKKEVAAEIATLEAELDARHENELKNLHINNNKTQPPSENKHKEEKPGDSASEYSDLKKEKKVSKAQKRRDKKDVEARGRNERIAEGEKLAKHGVRHKELEAVDSMLKERDLQLYEIPADGDCLFNALAHQLFLLGFSARGQELREGTSEYMRKHRDDFIPFLTNESTGDLLTPNQFEEYCDKIAKPTVWGGQPEIKAFSMSHQQPVEVVQGDASPLLIGEEFRTGDKKPLVITSTIEQVRGFDRRFSGGLGTALAVCGGRAIARPQTSRPPAKLAIKASHLRKRRLTRGMI